METVKDLASGGRENRERKMWKYHQQQEFLQTLGVDETGIEDQNKFKDFGEKIER